ncbi:hypothetical protein ACFQZ4_06260 [Catellatospora coxensis]
MSEPAARIRRALGTWDVVVLLALVAVAVVGALTVDGVASPGSGASWSWRRSRSP